MEYRGYDNVQENHNLSASLDMLCTCLCQDYAKEVKATQRIFHRDDCHICDSGRSSTICRSQHIFSCFLLPYQAPTSWAERHAPSLWMGIVIVHLYPFVVERNRFRHIPLFRKGYKRTRTLILPPRQSIHSAVASTALPAFVPVLHRYSFGFLSTKNVIVN